MTFVNQLTKFSGKTWEILKLLTWEELTNELRKYLGIFLGFLNWAAASS